MRTIGAVSLLVLAGAVQAWADGPINQNFSVKQVHLKGVIAQVTFDNSPPGPIHVQANGKPEVLKRLEVRAIGDEVYVHLADSPNGDAWFPWNLFNQWSQHSESADLQIHISAPLGTPVEIEDMIGRIVGGDLDAPLKLDGTSVDARFGRVTDAHVSIAGSGHIQLGAIQKDLDLEVAGSGKFDAASAQAARVEIAGGGNVNIGPLAAGLSTEVAGSGKIHVASINGPLDVSVAGSGSVFVDGGRANPFKVEIAGSGDVVLLGEAVNPHIAIYGSGSVKVNSMSGQLSKEIAGSGDFIVTGGGQPAPPPAPAMSAPPAPPAPPTPPHH